MNTKKKGSRNEHRSIDLLRARGYACTRSGASLGLWDIVGIGPKDFIVCQVKSNEWPGTEEMARLAAFVCPRNCHKEVHRWRDGELVPDIRHIP